jgi:5-(carboxyamino)imidazole ribonucleotide synthase
MLPPGSTIGILGGGQLGRMTALAAARLGYRTHVFADEPDSPAAQVAATATVARFEDAEALARFAAAIDVATCEFENVPAAAASLVAASRPVLPRPEIIEIAQDRLREKNFLRSIGIATADFRAVAGPDALADALREIGPRAVLKTVRLCYDGKGQVMLGADSSPEDAWHGMGLSISVARSRSSSPARRGAIGRPIRRSRTAMSITSSRRRTRRRGSIPKPPPRRLRSPAALRNGSISSASSRSRCS